MVFDLPSPSTRAFRPRLGKTLRTDSRPSAEWPISYQVVVNFEYYSSSVGIRGSIVPTEFFSWTN